jgi:hypothetical protein
MIKRFSYFVACLLLVLMPLQGLATVNMLACNSMMQSSTEKQSATDMPCHQMRGLSGEGKAEENKTGDNQHFSCKARCAAVCANMCALTAISVQVQSNFPVFLSQPIDFNHQDYNSITQPSLQRPPIYFI